jgi:hypothetical protein
MVLLRTPFPPLFTARVLAPGSGVLVAPAATRVYVASSFHFES